MAAIRSDASLAAIDSRNGWRIPAPAPCARTKQALALEAGCHRPDTVWVPSTGIAMGCAVLKVAFPQIQVDAVLGRRLLAPELARRESHRIEVLRILAQKRRVCIRNHKRSMSTINHAALGSSISWQARVSERIDVAGPDRVARLILWGRRCCTKNQKTKTKKRNDLRG